VEDLLAGIVGAHTKWCLAPQSAAVAVAGNGAILGSWGHNAHSATVFRIASMTKSFSTALVLLLRDEGVLDIDRPISAYAPELSSVVGPGSDPKPISLRDLLTMSSGLVTDDPWADRHLNATDNELDEWVRGGLRFAHPTGVAFEYSNLGFALVGRVVHRVTGQRLQTLVTERVLRPLEMNHTTWTAEALPIGAEVAPGWALHSGQLHTEPALADGIIAPMGGLWSNCIDLATWITYLSEAFVAEGAAERAATGVAGERGPLRRSTRRELQQVQRWYGNRNLTTPDGITRKLTGGYAMGLNVTANEDRVATIWHSGGLPGYGSTMQWRGGRGGVVALANVTYAPMTSAGATVLDALEFHRYLSPRRTDVSPELEIAAEGFVALVNGWSRERAEALFADNVLRDRLPDERSADIAARVVTPVTLLTTEARSASSATVTLRSGASIQRLEFELAPVGPPRIQSYRWV
jgi:CubicO group peptidase (beta-lactamase class C family)